MSTSKPTRDAPDTPPQRSTALLLLGDIGSTTWRMFVPTVGLALLGRVADDVTGTTAPWLLLLGASVGAVVAGVLIKRQLTTIDE